MDKQSDQENTSNTAPTGSKDRAQYHYERGCEYLRLELPADAVDELSEAIKLDPENAINYCMRGIGFSKLGDQKMLSPILQWRLHTMVNVSVRIITAALNTIIEDSLPRQLQIIHARLPSSRMRLCFTLTEV